tara:strand:+ start:139 stop:609 length:471 start_codon:yes stop_codon:yes gene_type:complete
MIGLFLIKFMVWVLVIYGATQIIVEGSIFDNFRQRMLTKKPWFGRLVNCVLCTSVWISLIFSVILWSPSEGLFILDIVDVDALMRLESALGSGVDTFGNMIATAVYIGYSLWVKFIITLCDMMAGSAMVWFLHVIEKKLTYRKRSEQRVINGILEE